MQIDTLGRNFIYKKEGVRLKAYLDIVGVPTIGVGFTYYPDGSKVKLGDIITLQRCDELFTLIVKTYEDAVTNLVKVKLTQNQFNALVSFTFNLGEGALKISSLLKYINSNAGETLIRVGFAMWNKAGGKAVEDLTIRRKDEADLYFKD